MEVTGAFLAEEASVVDGKLNIRGAGFLYPYVGPDRVARVTLVVITRVLQSDTAPKIGIQLIYPSGDSQAVEVEVPAESLFNEIGFAYWPLWLPVEIDGRYVLVVTCDDSSVSIPMSVRGDSIDNS